MKRTWALAILPLCALIGVHPASANTFAARAPAAAADSPWTDANYHPQPGGWQPYVLAPAGRIVAPVSVYSADDNAGLIENPNNILATDGQAATMESVTDREGSPLLTVDFGKEVAGQVQLHVLAAPSTMLGTVPEVPPVNICFSESTTYMATPSNSSADANEWQYAPDCDTANIWNGYPGQGYTFDSDSHSMPSLSGATFPTTISDPQIRGGFRYATIFLDGPGSIDIDSIDVLFTAAPLQTNLQAYPGHFLSSDNELNKIWYAGAYTVQTDTTMSNTAKSWPYSTGEADQADAQVPHADPNEEVIFDGAKRDRVVWQGDLSVEAPTVYLSTDDVPSVDNSLSSLAAQQLSDGYVPAESLVGPHNTGEERTYGEYVSWFIYNMYEHYLYTADRAYLGEWFPAMQQAMAWLEAQRSLDPQGLIDFTKSGSCGHYYYLACGHDTYTNALYYRNLNEMAELAGIEGDSTLKASYLSEASSVSSAINGELWDDTAGAYAQSRENPSMHTQDGNAMAILVGVAPPDRAARALAYLKANNWSPYGSLQVSSAEASSSIPAAYEPLPSYMEAEARLLTGDAGDGLDLMRTFWGYMLSNAGGPQSTFWEAVNTDGTPRVQYFTSLAHGWGAGPTIALTGAVLGVSPVSAGYATYSAIPHPGDLSWAQGTVPTPSGALAFDWQNNPNDGTFSESLTSPNGTVGQVAVPTFGNEITVTVNGQQVWNRTTASGYGAHADSSYVYLENVPAGDYAIVGSGEPAANVPEVPAVLALPLLGILPIVLGRRWRREGDGSR